MNLKSRTTQIITLIAIILLIIAGLFFIFRSYLTPVETTNLITPTIYQEKDYFSYNGENGKDALMLLEENTEVEKSNSGLVISINGRMVDDQKKEFWAFYVNGEIAEIGPSDYQTTEGDIIEWKVENY